MNLQRYIESKQKRIDAQFTPRSFCTRCQLSAQTCYCHLLRPFDPGLNFAILIHPHEARKRIATGRMSHLCLTGSHLIRGEDFTQDQQVNALIHDDRNFPVILYPGQNSTNLTKLQPDDRARFFPTAKKPVIFVVDGTWRTARKMLRLSENLRSLPRVCFSLSQLSKFRIRKQPSPECYSTIEAIHQTIELIGGDRGISAESLYLDRPHDRLLEVFYSMVERQIEFSAPTDR